MRGNARPHRVSYIEAGAPRSSPQGRRGGGPLLEQPGAEAAQPGSPAGSDSSEQDTPGPMHQARPPNSPTT